VTVPIGAVAPAFTLAGHDGSGRAGAGGEWTLADLRGSVVALVFYPADASPVCTAQLRAYTTDIGRFHDLGARVLALSPQSVEAHEDFARANDGFGFPLLADIDLVVGERYGVLGPLGFYRRSVYIIDAGGIVRYAHRSTAGLTFRPTAELIAAVTAARTPVIG
jgi:peroxiredoxin Q/BCP